MKLPGNLTAQQNCHSLTLSCIHINRKQKRNRILSKGYKYFTSNSGQEEVNFTSD